MTGLAAQAQEGVIPTRVELSLDAEERAWLAQHPVLRVSGPRAFPPFYFFGEQNLARGMAVDYLQAIAEPLGLTLRFEGPLPWPETLNRIKAREIDIAPCIARSPEREAFLLFSRPFLSFPLVIFSRKDAPFIGGLADLQDRKVALVRDNVVNEWLRRDGIGIAPVIVGTPLEALQAVALGEAEATIDNLAAGSYLIDTHGLVNLKVAAPTTYGNYDLQMAVRKDWPILQRILDKALAALSPAEHAALRARWLSVRYEYGITPTDVLKWLLLVGLSVLAVLGVMLRSNRRLKLEIRQRNAAEITLREREAELQSIFKAAPIGIGVAKQRVVQQANDQLCAMTGYERSELLGQSTRHLYPSEQVFHDVGGMIYRQTREQGKCTVETQWRRKDGALIQVLLSSTQTDPLDAGRGITFTALDVTAARLAEAEIKRQNELFATLLKNLQVGVFMVEAPSGQPLLANEAACRLLGRGILPDASRQNLAEVYKACKLATREPYPLDEMPILRGMDGLSTYVDDMVVLHPDGSEVLLEVFGSPVLDDGGRVWASLVSFIDITQRRLAEAALHKANEELEQRVAERTRELQEANEQLKQLDELKSAFISLVSHELRTPLTSVLGYAKVTGRTFKKHFLPLAEGEVGLLPRGQLILDNLQVIESEGGRLSRLINDLLDINKIESGTTEWHDAPMNLAEEARAAARIMDSEIVEKAGVTVELALNLEVPPIIADRDRIRQVFINLLSNALKFTQTGTIRLVVAPVEQGTMVEARVRDSGVGIPPEDQERIFDRFYQVTQAQDTGKARGTGLGLAICRQIIEHYGGRLWVESVPGQGSTFIFTLPAMGGEA